MKNKNTYWSAFSLFESVVAIAIISVLIAIGSLVYSNIVKAERPLAFYQALEEIDLHLADLRQTGLFVNQIFENETYRIEQQTSYHNGNKNLFLVEYSVFSQDKKWHTEKHLLTDPTHAE